MSHTLWSKNYTLVTLATILGAAGGIAGNFALSFLVYDETGSTLAAAILVAIQVFPNFLIPLLVSPIMDRLPRKPFLVGGDLVNGALYAAAGIYLLFQPFSYTGYLFFSLLLASLSSFDGLAYNAIFPRLIPDGFEEKGYTISTMIYPVLNVVMMPLAALLLDVIGVAWILIIQGALSVSASIIESRIDIVEHRKDGSLFSFTQWKNDLVEAVKLLKNDSGLCSTYIYMAVTNGVGNAFSPILVAFFPYRRRLYHRNVFLFLCGGIYRQKYRWVYPLSYHDTPEKTLQVCIFCLPDVRSDGYDSVMAPLSADACQPLPLRFSRHQQRHHAAGRCPEIHSGRLPGKIKCAGYRAFLRWIMYI